MGEKLIKSVISAPFFLLEASFIRSTSCFLSSGQRPDLLPPPYHIPPPSFFLLPSSFPSACLLPTVGRSAQLCFQPLFLLLLSWENSVLWLVLIPKSFKSLSLVLTPISSPVSIPTFPTACWYFRLDVFTLTCLKLIGSLPFLPTSVHSPYFPVLLMMSLFSQLPELGNWPLPLSALCLLLSFSN